MRNLCLLSQLALAAASGLAATAPRAQDGGFLSLPIARAERSRPLLNRRQSEDVAVPLYNISVLSYLIELSIGTPGQPVRVAVDTGSSELWVNPQCSTAQTEDQRQECEADGQYDPSQSSTYTDLNTGTTIPYGIGTAQIEYARDNVALPNSTIDLQNIQFGVATASEDLNEGILGLSFGNVSAQRDLSYSNFIDELQLQKVTESRAFSVALGPQDGHNEGVLIFGGVDTGKFVGPLRMIPILGPQGSESLWRYWVKLDSVGSTASGSSHKYDSSATAVVLDTGSSLCTLPETVVDGMVQDAGGNVDSNGNIIVPCELADSRNTFDFQFGNVTIRIPYGNLIIQADVQTCILGVAPESNGSIALLGDTFLRSAYVVFDQTNMEIAMAPYADCGRHEQSIPAGGVRGIEGTCTSAATGTSASGTNLGSQSDAGSDPGSSSNPSGGGDDTDQGAGDDSSAAPGWAVSWALMASLGLLQLILVGSFW